MINTNYTKYSMALKEQLGLLSKKIFTFLLYTLLFCSLFISIIQTIRTFVFDLYLVPSSSMENTLLPGDIIGVRKIKNPLQHIERNQIIVFKFPNNPKLNFVKRCVALPGDTVLVSKSMVTVNRQPEKYNENVLFSCKVNSHGSPANMLDSLGIWYSSVVKNNDLKNQWTIVSNLNSIDSIAKSLNFSNFTEINYAAKAYRKIYPQNTPLLTSRDNWGPVVVPFKGMKITSDTIGFYWHFQMVKKFEGHTLTLVQGQLHVDGMVKDFYTVKKNYYLMIGDNRHYSRDSRFWGFVPDDYIVGETLGIIFSSTYPFSISNLRWNRCFVNTNKTNK